MPSEAIPRLRAPVVKSGNSEETHEYERLKCISAYTNLIGIQPTANKKDDLDHSGLVTMAGDSNDGGASSGRTTVDHGVEDFQDQSKKLSFFRLVVIISTLAFTLFVSFIDQTSVSTSLPKIAESLDAFESISWAGTSFLVANTAFQLTSGRLSDIFGRRNCLMVCMCLLMLGDLLCGFSKTAAELYIFRGIAGIGAGGINNLVMIIFSDMTTLQQRGKYQGILETNIALGNGIGPILGGAFSQSAATWRWTFWFVPLVTLMAGIGIFTALPQPKITGSRMAKVKLLDYSGMLLSIMSVIFLLIPISSGGSTWAWSSPLIISFLVFGCLLAIAFVIVEWKPIAVAPVMPMRLFDRRAAKIMFTHNFITGIVYYSDLYYLPLYFQVVRGHSPIMSGVLILPLMLGFSIASSSGGWILSRLGRCNPVIRAGYLLWTAGAGGRLCFNQSTSMGVVITCLLIEGLGLGFSFQPVMIALLANTRKEDRAVVTGLRNFLRTNGGAAGLAICATILNNVLKSKLPADLANRGAMQLINNLHTLTTEERSVVKAAYMAGLKSTFYLGAPLMGICLLSSLAVRDVQLSTAGSTEQQKVEEKGHSQDDPQRSRDAEVAISPQGSEEVRAIPAPTEIAK